MKVDNKLCPRARSGTFPADKDWPWESEPTSTQAMSIVCEQRRLLSQVESQILIKNEDILMGEFAFGQEMLDMAQLVDSFRGLLRVSEFEKEERGEEEGLLLSGIGSRAQTRGLCDLDWEVLNREQKIIDDFGRVKGEGGLDSQEEGAEGEGEIRNSRGGRVRGKFAKNHIKNYEFQKGGKVDDLKETGIVGKSGLELDIEGANRRAELEKRKARLNVESRRIFEKMVKTDGLDLEDLNEGGFGFSDNPELSWVGVNFGESEKDLFKDSVRNSTLNVSMEHQIGFLRKEMDMGMDWDTAKLSDFKLRRAELPLSNGTGKGQVIYNILIQYSYIYYLPVCLSIYLFLHIFTYLLLII